MSDNIAEIVGGDANTASDSPVVETLQGDPKAAAPAGTDGVSQEPKEPQEAKVVPLAALHESRAEQKRLKAELEQMRQAQAQRDEMLQKRLDALTKANQPPGPTLEENPAQYLDQKLERVQQTLAEQQTHAQQRQQYEQQQASIQRAAMAVQHAEARFSQATPDYHDAVNYLRDVRVRELTDGYGLDPTTAAQQAQKELVEFAFYNAQRQADPAEAAYRMAAVRGYQKKAEPAATGATPAEKLATQQKGAAAKSLGGGGAPAGKLTVEALLSMSEDEFHAATSGDKWQKVAGG